MKVSQLDRLREIALDHHGFVTVSQAREVGIPPVELAKLRARGRLEWKAPGVYRVPLVPESQADALHLAVLWTGHPDARLSHETALEAWDLTESMSDRIHLTVPRRARIRRKGGENYRLVHEDVEASHATWWQGIPIVSPEWALNQCLRPEVPSAVLRPAIESARTWGLISEDTSECLWSRLESRRAPERP